MALANATSWFCNFTVASCFLTTMETDSGKTFTFLFLALMVFSAFLFIYVFVPETAGKTILENIENTQKRFGVKKEK